MPSVRLFLVSGRPVGALKWRLVRINVLMVFVHPLAPFSVAICVGLSLSNLWPFSIIMVFVHRFGLLLVSDRRRQHARERQFGKKNVVHFLANIEYLHLLTYFFIEQWSRDISSVEKAKNSVDLSLRAGDRGEGKKQLQERNPEKEIYGAKTLKAGSKSNTVALGNMGQLGSEQFRAVGTQE